MTEEASVVDAVLTAVAAGARIVRDGLVDRRGETSDIVNPSGEAVIGADVWANERFVERIAPIDGVGSIASEEEPDPVDVGDGLGVAIDPLDGSSNVASNNLCGTIVGIFDGDLPAGGDQLLASAYVLYGPITTMVTAVDEQVTEMVILEETVQPLQRDMALPTDPVVYGFGGRVPDWTPAFASFASDIEQELKLRYGGAMVGDVNQVLHHGGVFSYPGLSDRPQGKLRLQFEGLPMAHIIETAGGASSDGERSLLERPAMELHQRTPVHLGNRSLIGRLEKALGGH